MLAYVQNMHLKVNTTQLAQFNRRYSLTESNDGITLRYTDAIQLIVYSQSTLMSSSSDASKSMKTYSSLASSSSLSVISGVPKGHFIWFLLRTLLMDQPPFCTLLLSTP